MIKFIKAGLLILLVVLPLLVDRSLVDAFATPKAIVLWLSSFLFATLLFYAKARHGSFVIENPRNDTRRIVWAFAIMILSFVPSLFVASSLHTAIFGTYRYYGFGLVPWVAYFFLFLVAFKVSDAAFLRQAATIAVAAGLLVCIYALIQIQGLDPLYWRVSTRTRPFSTLGSPQFLAAYLGLLMPICFSLVLETQRFWLRTAFIFAFSIFFYVVMNTLTRSVWLGLPLGFVVWGFYVGRAYWGQHKKTIGLFVAIACCIFGATVVEPFLAREPSPILGRFQVFLSTKEHSARGRFYLWLTALDIFRDHPVLGVGLDNFETKFLRYRHIEHSRLTGRLSTTAPVHNDFLQVLTTTGITGFSGYLFFLISAFVYFYRLRSTLQHQERALVGGVLAGLAVLGVFGQFNFSVVDTSGCAAIFLGAAAALGKRVDSVNGTDSVNQARSKIKSMLFILGALLTLSALLWVSWYCVKLYLGDRYFGKAITASNRGRYGQGDYYFALSKKYNPNIRERYLAQANTFFQRSRVRIL